MLSARLILLVLATTLICNDSLGGEPNDRIDQVLAVMMKMNEKIDVLAGKVNDIEETVGDVKKQVNAVDKKLEIVDIEVKYNTDTWEFVGKGHQGSHEEKLFYKNNTTVRDCLSYCYRKRRHDGGRWNGAVWGGAGGGCWCEKNDRGHVEASDYLHFKAPLGH